MSSLWTAVSIVININTPREEEHLCCLSTTSRDYVNIQLGGEHPHVSN
jgi:hypothetical protein